jgi:hypothetical protein
MKAQGKSYLYIRLIFVKNLHFSSLHRRKKLLFIKGVDYCFPDCDNL